jgi:GT2 family glycosyltransferase
VLSAHCQPSALLVTVNYKGEKSTLELLASLSRLNSFSSLDIIVVDNGSGEENLSQLRTATTSLPNVQLLALPTNRGYFGAAKLAYDHYLAQGHKLPDWIVVCNHDVVIDDENFFQRLTRQDPMNIGMIAPRILVPPSYLNQTPFMRRPPGRVRWLTLRLIYSSYAAAAVWDWLSRQKRSFKGVLQRCHIKANASSSDKTTEIYAPHGSFLIFSRRYFAAGGTLDQELFLYWEEISVAETCRSLGLAIVYDPSLHVLHNEHQSTGKRISRFSYDCHKNAFEYIRFRYLSGSRQMSGAYRHD